MQRRFESDPLFQATHAAAAGAHSQGQPRSIRTPPSCPRSRDRRRRRRAPVRVLDRPDTPTPEVQLLSNGRYHVMVTNAGGGYSRWKDLAVTRWREDAHPRQLGHVLLPPRRGERRVLVDRAPADAASAPNSYEAIFSEARAEFRRRDRRLRDAHRDRRLARGRHRAAPASRITNRSRTRADDRGDELRGGRARARRRRRAAPGVQQSVRADRDPAAAAGDPVHAPAPLARRAAALDVPPDGRPRRRRRRDVSYETDRMQFIGRGRTVAAPAGDGRAPRRSPTARARCSIPIVAIRQPDHARAAASRPRSTSSPASPRRATPRSALVEKYQDRHLADRVFDLAWTHSQVMLRQLNATEADAQLYGAPRRLGHLRQRLAARRARRPDAEPPRAIRPVGLRDLRRPADRAAADRRPGEHRPRPPAGAGARVLAPEGAGGRSRDLERGPRRLPAGAAGPDHGPDRRRRRGARDRPAGRHLRAAAPSRSRTRTASCCRPSRASSSPTDGGTPGGAARPPRRRRSCGSRASCRPRHAPRRAADRAEPPRARPDPVNGLGGFTPDGREYVITPRRGPATPAPWVNVLANPDFGTVVSESGAAYTWSENAHEFRLTPWHNDPVSDASGEAFYLRDEETGHFWSPDAAARAAAPTPTSPATASATASSSTPRTASAPSCGSTSPSTRR